jgi:dipicolinate synthase subunit A
MVSVIGGDLRIVKLVELLAKDDFKIYTYGLEKADKLKDNEKVKFCDTIEEAIGLTKVVIGPVPFSSNNIDINAPYSERKIKIQEILCNMAGKALLAGSIKPEIENEAKQENVNIIDLLKKEELVVLNAIATAEGTIQVAMEETSKTIHGSNILIMGYGRIGKVLSKMLLGIGANVYCEARKKEDLAWIKAYGYTPIDLANLKETLNKFDIIVNTIPTLILDKSHLQNVNKECLIIDVASMPGGIDQEAAKELGIRTLWALSLPGKVAPTTSAEYIKETIDHILKEI